MTNISKIVELKVDPLCSAVSGRVVFEKGPRWLDLTLVRDAHTLYRDPAQRASKSMSDEQAKSIRDALIELYPLEATAPVVEKPKVEYVASGRYISRRTTSVKSVTEAKAYGWAETREDAVTMAALLNAAEGNSVA